MIIDELQEKMPEYVVKKITEEGIEDVLALMRSNEYFYARTQGHEVTKAECIEDIDALPPHVDYSKKTYVALYKANKCMALVDFVEGYPNEGIGYIGLLMLELGQHGKGIGKQIVTCLYDIAREKGFERIELACHATNEKGFSFWSKMGFKKIRQTERVTDRKSYTLLSMQYRL